MQQYPRQAARLAQAGYGAFIIPQNSARFRYSGAAYYQRHEHERYLKFSAQTGIHGRRLRHRYHLSRGRLEALKIRTEIVTSEFPPILDAQRSEHDATAAAAEQFSLFGP